MKLGTPAATMLVTVSTNVSIHHVVIIVTNVNNSTTSITTSIAMH